MNVYITSTGHYLPGKAVDNDEVENVLGLIHGKKSRLKNKILKSNGILQRHYAINDKQETQISNSDMAANAANNCIENSYLSSAKIQMLSCATSHGICSSSMMALKTAFNNVKCESSENALVVASELTSRLFKNARYEQIEGNEVDFNAEFLRWMLSDGAGALLLENQPRPNGKSIRIDWIKSFSHANLFPVCMSVGQARNETQKTWQDYHSYAEAEKAGALMLRQDVRLLDNIVSVGVQGFLTLIAEGHVDPSKIDHVLCHFSSKYFKSKIFDMLETSGASIPEHKWYTNLYERGNTGCASIFIMLDEFIKTHDLTAGETIFCMVPESGRFNCAYMHLTVAG